MTRFVPLGKHGVGRIKDSGGRLAAILRQIELERISLRESIKTAPCERADCACPDGQPCSFDGVSS